MKHTLQVLQLLCLFCLCACDTDQAPPKNARLPEATQSGKNTVGFTREDGQVWEPFYECTLFDNPCAKISANVGNPFVAQNGIGFQFSRRNKDAHSSLTIISGLAGTVSSTGEKIDSVSLIFQSESWPNDGGTYTFPLPGSRFTVTKFDKANQIIAGEFHLVLKNQAGKTVTLSNGRFDFKFNACACDG
jgi:hypothetical protein